ncbi:M20/M25/M40 family metallo-hydrolase [Staphylococcus hyicus]|uniref:M20/M25/M40 family metallo-hydrolase n=1 Tax=Staphylococcus hyicus TaxID=1284 RepID=UPI00211C1658|nr:M20/M25/M40 family metallo-hydrolase [Staphylococcus hyicus]MCQ9290840.1 M20/M25/M40 family metallo-hydrolase [Staphylococcus hyicus]MCQ9306082.1 M20/M25/M40 family metallo-hydrolase [Staphylococcus hyicus]MCQ9308494.1 M20/M25/M40 family metallo-hydrolase [Staphylococcus hyicus]MCQ9310916.1 M20/M25/M40 family metallo-hydrolase [Staphylococcus hyicus]
MINQQRLIQTFLELVQIDSETGRENEIQPILKEKFKALGLDVKEDNAKALTHFGANNLICTLKATDENRDKIYFTSHMDTVEPGKNVKPIIKEDGYIYSDGTTVLGADDKAGLAVILEVLEVIQTNEIPHGQLQFVITVGEESGLVGAKVLDASLLDADYGYALDASVPVGDITIGAPYQMKMHATIHGKKAHASTPKEGISAINIAAKAISQMKLGQVDNETTANIGSFNGGGPTNVVTDLVHIWAEARSHSKAKIDAQTEHMKATFIEAAENYDASAEVESELSYPGFKIDEDEKVYQVAKKASLTLGFNANSSIGGGGSDGNIINGFGIPTVILGVGYEYIHTTKERISKQSLVDLARYVLKIIENA